MALGGTQIGAGHAAFVAKAATRVVGSGLVIITEGPLGNRGHHALFFNPRGVAANLA